MRRTLYLLRGLPGSGKSTLAASMRCIRIEADAFFTDAHGVYRFDADKLAEAHAWCQDTTRWLLNRSDDAPGSNVVVSNTFSQAWEMQPYIDMARQADARLVVIDLFDGGGLTDDELAARNVHDVPVKVIERMRARWEKRWRDHL